MKNVNDILSKIDRHSGMTVPEGYFDDFAARMMEQLPQHQALKAENEPKAKPSLWFRIRPYVYMAAMFAGIWCMLNIFKLIGADSTDLSVDNNPVIARALSNDSFVDEYYLYDMDENELLEDMYDMGLSPDEITDTTSEESPLSI